jgi:phosphoribosylformimino-5-aminoimidazole carboxamide ribonucleotide (ProFAR) isomerase
LRDGTLAGPDVEGALRIARASGVRVLLSGGVGTLEHVEAAAHGLEALILGRALHEGRFTLREAMARLRPAEPGGPG